MSLPRSQSASSEFAEVGISFRAFLGQNISSELYSRRSPSISQPDKMEISSWRPFRDVRRGEARIGVDLRSGSSIFTRSRERRRRGGFLNSRIRKTPPVPQLFPRRKFQLVRSGSNICKICNLIRKKSRRLPFSRSRRRKFRGN